MDSSTTEVPETEPDELTVEIKDGEYHGATFGNKKETNEVKLKRTLKITRITTNDYYGQDQKRKKQSEEVIRVEAEPDELHVETTRKDGKVTEQIETQGREQLQKLLNVSGVSEEYDVSNIPTVSHRFSSSKNFGKEKMKPQEETKSAQETLMISNSNPKTIAARLYQDRPTTKKVSIRGGQFEGTTIGNQTNENKFVGEVYYHKTDVINNTYYCSGKPGSACQPTKEEYEEFLDRAKKYFSKFHEEHENFNSEPIKMLVDMEELEHDKKSGDTRNGFGRDITKIELKDFFQPVNDKQTFHVMVLGGAGAGKSTLSRKYAKEIAKKKFDSLKNIDLIWSINACDLQYCTPSTAFNLFFTQQMAKYPETKLTEPMKEAGSQWMENITNKKMIVIDGLDQCQKPIVGMYQQFDSQTPVEANANVAAVMAGHIWHGAFVLTTSRFEVFPNLSPAQRPDKVIALRGFDSKNLENAAHQLIPERSAEMLFYLTNNVPKLYALCSTPLFLFYTTRLYKEGFKNLPNSITGLLSEIFLKFMRSAHAKRPDVGLVTKLAFCGMMDNRFEFTAKYLKKLGIDFNRLSGLLESVGILEPGQITAMEVDRQYYFPHQVLQEFCGALHILNFDRDEVRSLVTLKLNEPHMELMRKLFYGMIMDNAVTLRMGNFIRDGECSVEECREILSAQLLSMTQTGVLYDIKQIALINECGHDVVQSVQSRIDRIEIYDANIVRNDLIILASMIKQCSPLQKVFIVALYLDSVVLNYFTNCYKHVGFYKVGYHLLESITSERFDPVRAMIDETTEVYTVTMYCPDEVKNSFLLHWISQDNISFKAMGLRNGVTIRNLELLLQFLAKFRMVCVGVTLDSTISMEEVSSITANMEKKRRYVELFKIWDDCLTEKKVAIYLALLKELNCDGLRLFRCDLKETLLDHMATECKDRKIRLKIFRICDKVLTAKGFANISAVVKATACMRAALVKCDLNKSKLLEFATGFEKNGCKLKILSLWDKVLESDGYYAISAAIKASSCKQIRFGNCDLCKEKILRFKEGVKATGCKLQNIIITEKIMNDAEDFFALTAALKESDCPVLQLQDCDLIKDKIDYLTEGCRKNNVKLTKLSLWDKHLVQEGFRAIPTVIKASESEAIVLGNCGLCKEKLSNFGIGIEDNQCKFQILVIKDDAMEGSGYKELATVLKLSGNPELQLKFCLLDESKIESLTEGCLKENVMIPKLLIVDKGFRPSHGMISALSKLMHDVCYEVVIRGWMLEQSEKNELIEMYKQETSKVKSLKLPGMRAINKCKFTEFGLRETVLHLRQLLPK